MRRHPQLQAGNESEGGFTLLELLVVLAVMGLLIAASPLVMTSAKPGIELRAATNDITRALRAARLQSISMQQDVFVRFDVATNNYRLSTELEDRALPKEIILDASALTHRPSVSGEKILFHPDGSSSGGVVTLTSHQQSHQVSVQPLTGRVTADD